MEHDASGMPLTAGIAILFSVFFPLTRIYRAVFFKSVRVDWLLLLLDLLRGAHFALFVAIIGGLVYEPLMQELVREKLALFLAGVIGAATAFNSDKWFLEYVKKYGKEELE